MKKELKEITHSFGGAALLTGAACVTYAIGGPLVQSVFGGILTNISSNLVEKAEYQKVKELVFAPNPSDLNHDIAKLVSKAMVWALKNIRLLYRRKIDFSFLKDDVDKVIEGLIAEIENLNNANFLEGQLGVIDGVNYSDVQSILEVYFKDLPVVNPIHPFPDFFHEKFLENFQLCFGELLKMDKHKKARIAYTRFLQTTMLRNLNLSLANDAVILAEIKSLRESIVHIDVENQSEKIKGRLDIVVSPIRENIDILIDHTGQILEKVERLIEKTDNVEKKTDVILQELVKISDVVQQSIENQKKIEVIDETEVLLQYLDWIIHQHSRLQLHSIPEASTFPYVELEKVYVALKVDRTGDFELRNENVLLEEEVTLLALTIGEEKTAEGKEVIRASILRGKAIPKAWNVNYQKVDRFASDEIITLGEAIQKERRLIMLGDPGSGKTTVARWITLKFALSLKKYLYSDKNPNYLSVKIPEHQIDPDKPNSNALINIGPVRVPIIIRISDYAELYAQEPIPIIEYLGKHTWNKQAIRGEDGIIASDALNKVLRHYLSEGQAIVILDGMDEVTSNRIHILKEIETFIEVWINRQGSVKGDFNDNLLNVLGLPPMKIGGNQIIITSRIVGYHASPIKTNLTRVFVEPMKRQAVEHFCKIWTSNVYKQIYKNRLELEEIASKAKEESDGLVKAIYDDNKPRIRELASNPLLVTILALVYRHNNGELPEQRAKLYQVALERLYQNWRNSPLKVTEIAYVLSPLAYEMHGKYASGMIEEVELKKIIKKHLAAYHKIKVDDEYPPDFEEIVEVFLKEIRENVGILSCRAQQLYGFIHLTFQEYLAACHMVRHESNASEHILEKIDHPRWREPLLLAIGHYSINKDKETFNNLLVKILEADDFLGILFPIGSLLIVKALPEIDIDKIKQETLQKLIEKLLNLHAQRELLKRFESVQETIVQAFFLLQSSNLKSKVEKSILNLLAKFYNQSNYVLAVADILNKTNWFNGQLLAKFIELRAVDSNVWGFPISILLQKACSAEASGKASLIIKPLPNSEKVSDEDRFRELKWQAQIGKEFLAKLNKRTELTQKEFFINLIRAKRQLFRSQELIGQIQSDYRLLSLVTALFGGFGDLGSLKQRAHFTKHKFFTRLSNDERQSLAEGDESYKLYYQSLVVLEDLISLEGNSSDIFNKLIAKNYIDYNGVMSTGFAEIEKMEDLDWENVGQKRELYQILYRTKTNTSFFSQTNETIQFKQAFLYRDSELMRPLIRVLRNHTKGDDVAEGLKKLYDSISDLEKVEALIGLWSIGEDVHSFLNDKLKNGFIESLRRIVIVNKPSLCRSITLVEKSMNEELSKALEFEKWWDIYAFFGKVFLEHIAIPFEKSWAGSQVESATKNPLIFTNLLAKLLFEVNPDKTYNFAVILDTYEKHDHKVYQKLLFDAYKAPNVSYSDSIEKKWNVEPIPMRLLEEDIPFTVYHNLRTYPIENELQHVYANGFRNMVLFTLSNQLEENQQLIPEFLLQCLVNKADEVFAYVVRKYHLTTLEVSNYFGLVRGIEGLINALTDPYYKVKALIALLNVNFWKRKEIISQAHYFAKEIASPEQSAYVLLKIAPVYAQQKRKDVLEEIKSLIYQVANPLLKSQLLIKLSAFYSEADQDFFLKDSLSSLHQVSNDNAKANLIEIILKQSEFRSLLWEEHITAVKTIDDLWYRSKANNRLGQYLLKNSQTVFKNFNSAFIPVLLIGAASELLTELDTQVDRQDLLWNQLMDSENKQDIIEEVMNQKIQEGIPLSLKVAQVVNQLLIEQEVVILQILLPLIKKPEPEAEWMVRRWKQYEDIPNLNISTKQLATFYLAEASKSFILEELPPIIALHDSLSNGELRNRISTFFDRGVVKIKRTFRYLSASKLEKGVIYSAAKLKIFSTFSLHILYDEPEYLDSWVELFNGGDKEAKKVLENIFEITPIFWERFKGYFLQGDSKLKKSLFYSLVHIYYEGNPQQYMPDDLLSLIRQTDVKTIENGSFLPNNCKSIVEILDELSIEEDYPFYTTIDHANDLLEKQYTTIHQLVVMEKEILSKKLNEVAHSIYHYGRVVSII